MKSKDYQGFTLLELLIAVTIFSIVSIAIYSSFSVGIRAWRKAEESYKVRQEARHALEDIGYELRTAVNFTPVPFEGSSDCVSFSRVLKSSNKYSEGIFKITYTFDAEAKSLYYILQTYQESVQEESGIKSILTSGISGFQLKYAYLDGEEVIWRDDWQSDEIDVPFGVKVSLFYPSQSKGQDIEFSETILIPTGALKEGS